MKIKTAKFLQFEISTTSKQAILTCGSSDEAMAFHFQHFQPSGNFLDPSRLWSASLSPAAITRLEKCDVLK